MKSFDLERERFLSLLFDEGQYSCFTDSPFGFKVSDKPESGDLFFCINALHPTEDKAPVKEWHSANSPRRADANVICHRNFLIELDDCPLGEQIKKVTEVLPVSSIVYSGGKSYHFIISLEEPLDSKTYKSWAKRLYKLIDGIDPACKNVSRLSRLPAVYRPDTGKKQELVSLGVRIPNKDIEALLPKEVKRPTYSKSNRAKYMPEVIMRACIFPDEVMEEFNLGGRNAFFFWLYNRMNDAEVDYEAREEIVSRAYNELRDISGFSWEEARNAARLRD